MNQDFLKSLSLTLKYEGGYSNNPDDPGGPTNFGITWREYNAHRTKKGLSTRSVRYITTDEMHDIYKNNYWNIASCNILPPGVDFAVFDLAVNNGVGRAKQFLSTANKFHPNADSETLINSICYQRLAFDKRLGRLWRVFGKGWSRRIEGVRRQSLTLASNAKKETENTTNNIIVCGNLNILITNNTILPSILVTAN